MSNKQVVVTGIGLRSCLGCLENTWHNVLLGKSGIRLQQPFSELPTYPLGLIQENNLAKFSDLTEAIVKDALKDAKLDIPLSNCGVVIGSSRGCQATWEDISSDFSLLEGISWLETLPYEGSVINWVIE